MPDEIIRLIYYECREIDKPTPTLDWGRPSTDVHLPKVRGVASKLRLLSKRIKNVIDDVMWQTVRIRSTAASMYGLHWLTTSNPRLCERVQAIEYHLTPSPFSQESDQFASPLNFLQYPEYFNQDTYEMTIGQIIPPWGEPQDVYERFRRLQHPEIAENESDHRTTRLQYSNNYRHTEGTFYNHNMDFTYLIGVALASRSFPNLRKFTVSSFQDEDFPLWWQLALNDSVKRGLVNDALAGVPVDEVFEKPEPGYLMPALTLPAIRAFYVVLYGLWRRNTKTVAVSPISDLTLQWIPQHLDKLPSFWQYWTPAALSPITNFSCLNISNQLPMDWVFGYFRLHILAPMRETVEVLKLGYSRWNYKKPRWLRRQQDYFNPGPNHPNPWQNFYNERAGAPADNVLPLEALLMPFLEPLLESPYRRDWDPNDETVLEPTPEYERAVILQLESLMPRLLQVFDEPDTDNPDESYLPRLRELHLKPWLSVANPYNFANMFDLFLHQWDEKKASALEPQVTFSRVHLESLDLPLGLNAELDPSTGLMVNHFVRPSWEDVIRIIETKHYRGGVPAPNATVTHDNLWQATVDPQRDWQWISLPGGGRIVAWDRAYTNRVFIKPWGECWSWMDDEAKRNRYMERVANYLPFSFVLVIMSRILT